MPDILRDNARVLVMALAICVQELGRKVFVKSESGESSAAMARRDKQEAMIGVTRDVSQGT
jgi:hypothetical protein